jgi:3-keto-5-aminohexanoate cleavage enzyme
MIKLPDNKVIITAAVTGAWPLVTKAMNPAVPEQPDEIAEAAYACCQEGAAICHMHARDQEGKSTGAKEVYRDIHDRIRARCNIILQDSTGGGPNLSVEERVACVQAGPDMASLNMGSLMRIAGPYKGVPWANMPEDIEAYVTKMRQAGVKPELEVYGHAMLREVNGLIKKDLIEKPYYINFVMGMTYQGAVEATPKHLYSLIDFLPQDAIFNVTAVGAAHDHHGDDSGRVRQGRFGGQSLLPQRGTRQEQCPVGGQGGEDCPGIEQRTGNSGGGKGDSGTQDLVNVRKAGGAV